MEVWADPATRLQLRLCPCARTRLCLYLIFVKNLINHFQLSALHCIVLTVLSPSLMYLHYCRHCTSDAPSSHHHRPPRSVDSVACRGSPLDSGHSRLKWLQ